MLASLFTLASLVGPILTSPALADITADPGGPYTGILGENVQFRGTAVADGGRVARYQWDFGDLTVGSSPGATINHKYQSTGEFTVTLTVVDIDGFTSQPVTTTATIAESTSATTSTSAPTTSTSTTSPTTTSPTSSSTTTTTLPTTTSTSLPTGSTATNTPTTSLPKNSTAVNTSTTSTTATTFEVVSPAEGLTATSFSLVPPTVFVGGEIALTVVLAADLPGKATVQFILDGQPLGEAVTLDAQEVSDGSAVGAVFTRTLPSGLQTGSYRVELATTERPPQVLASLTIEVIAAIPPTQEDPRAPQPSPTPSNGPGLIVAIAVSSAVAIPAVGLGVTTIYRRKTIVRRLDGRG